MKNITFSEEPFAYNSNHNVRVNVKSSFKNVINNIENTQFVWSYDVAIENLNPFPIQLLSRYWKVFDANGYIEEVEGEGVIGQQPVIVSGETFSYSSQVKLFTNSGMMLGFYKMQDAVGNDLQVNIPAFSLDISLEEMRVN
jgi:ApaG protein